MSHGCPGPFPVPWSSVQDELFETPEALAPTTAAAAEEGIIGNPWTDQQVFFKFGFIECERFCHIFKTGGFQAQESSSPLQSVQVTTNI